MNTLGISNVECLMNDRELLRLMAVRGGPVTLVDLFRCRPRWAVEAHHRCVAKGWVEAVPGLADRHQLTAAGRDTLTPGHRTTRKVPPLSQPIPVPNQED